MNTLRAMYGLRRVNLLVVNRLMSALTIHLLNLPSKSSATHFAQGLQDLQAMSLNHQFAARCIEIITSLAAKWNIALPDSLTSRSEPGTQRRFPSPPSSTFWAASIPRKQSSDNESKSATSSSSQRGSPFMPPTSQLVQRPDSFAPFYGDSSTTLDPTQGSNAFWTPFPLQNAPLPPQNTGPSMAMHMTPVDSPSGQPWHAFNSPVNVASPHPQQQHSQQSLQSMMDGMAFQGWQWQN